MKIYVIIAMCSIASLSAHQDVKKCEISDKKVAPVSKKQEAHKALNSNKKIISLNKNAVLEDCIDVVIYTSKAPIILTKKALGRISINGAKQTKEDIIWNYIFADAAVSLYKMEASEEMMEKYLQNIMDQHGLTRNQIKQMFAQAGYTFAEGVEQLKMMYLIDNLLSYKIKSRLVVTEESVLKYYNEHPQYSVGSYKLQTGFIPASDITEDEVLAWDTIKSTFPGIEWSDSYWLQDDEISEQRSFIKELKLKQISALEDVPGGFEVLRMVEKNDRNLKTFEQSQKEIIEKLRAPLFEKLLKEYKQDLAKEYEIIYLD